MATYNIPEQNIEKLEKKLQTLRNKFIKNGVSFFFEKGEPFFEKVEIDGVKETIKFIPVTVSGEYKVDGWKFIATLEHTDMGNIIRTYDQETQDLVQLPDRFRTCSPVCEHCNTNRPRKNTFIVQNEETGEYKQVGVSCLKEYTKGLSAEDAARYMRYLDEPEKYLHFEASEATKYYNVEELLHYFTEATLRWGFASNQYSSSVTPSTKVRGIFCYEVCTKKLKDSETEEEMKEVNFNAFRPEVNDRVQDMLKWVKETESDGSYMNNLKVIVLNGFCTTRDLGILASLPHAWDKELEHRAEEEQRAEELKEKQVSQWVGEVKSRMTFPVKSCKLITSFDSQFGTTWLYEFLTPDGNVLKWFASSRIKDTDNIESVTGTVKDHKEYQGVKETHINRCTVNLKLSVSSDKEHKTYTGPEVASLPI